MPGGKLSVWQGALCPTHGSAGSGGEPFALYSLGTISDRLTRPQAFGDFCTMTIYKRCWSGDRSGVAFGRCSSSEASQLEFAVIIGMGERGRRGDACCSLWLS